MVSDGKGGKIRVKKPKPGKKGKDGKEKKWYDNVAEFSDATTDSDAVDLDAMTPEERERYLAERAKRREEREKRRREKYGDKYDEMFAAKEAYVFPLGFAWSGGGSCWMKTTSALLTFALFWDKLTTNAQLLTFVSFE